MPLKVVTAGESHGPGLTTIVEGLPAGLELDQESIDGDMARRQLGHGRGGRMKIEKDSAQVTAGVRHGRTLGGPVALQVANRDFKNWEERMNPWPVEADVPEVHLPRPGHADLAGVQKFGFTDVRNVLERASARETAARVAGGALAKTFLRALGVEVVSHVIQIGAVKAPLGEDLVAGGLRGRRRFAGALPRRRRDEGDGRGDQRPAEAQRVDRRHLRAARLRARAGARLARVVGDAARRPDRGGAAFDPGRQGRRARRRLRSGRAPGLGGPRRDLLLRRARLLPRDEPLRRARGRDDDGRAARRARGDEADPDPDQAAALGRHLDPRAGPGAARAHGLLRRPGRRRGGGGDAGDRAGRRLPRQVRRRSHRRRSRGRRRLSARIGWIPRS